MLQTGSRNGRNSSPKTRSSKTSRPNPSMSLITDHFIAGLCLNGTSVFDADSVRHLVRHYASDGHDDGPRFLPDVDVCSDTAACNLLLSEVLTKCKTLGATTDSDRRQAAAARWYRAEDMCFTTNCTFRGYGHLGHVFSSGVTSGTVLERARGLINYVLGPLNGEALNAIFQRCGHGPGGTTRLSRRNAGACTKFSGIPEASPAISDLVHALSGLYPEWIPDGGFKPRSSSKMAYVPKNAKMDRIISSEPDLNLFFQKGVGAYWKTRLKRHAVTGVARSSPLGEFTTIDLQTQLPNQMAARAGSIDGLLATIDLSMASDTVSYELVKWLLPHDWFSLIQRLRVGSVEVIDPVTGDSVGARPVEKFSSMGNGFTFELETLIFWALTKALSDLSGFKSPIFVYGDDIVADVGLLNGDLQLLLTICGFVLNEKKSHFTGKYRESCGKHYYGGADITPFYIREDVSTTYTLLLLCNNMRRWLARRDIDFAGKGPLMELHASLVKFLPTTLRRPAIPDGYGDGSLIGTKDEIQSIACDALRKGTELWRKFSGWEGRVCFTTIPVFKFQSSTDYGVLIASLWSLCRKTQTYLGKWLTGSAVDFTAVDFFFGMTPRDVRLIDICRKPDEYGLPDVVGYRRIPIVCRHFTEL